MKPLLCVFVLLFLFSNSKAQKSADSVSFHIRYEVLTKPGQTILVGYFDKDEKNAGATVSEKWTYNFTTKNKNQNIQIFTMGGREAGTRSRARIWTKVNIYVNDKLIKTKEEKVLGLGPTLQVNLNDL